MADVLEVDLGDRGGVHRFRHDQEVRDWLDAQLNAWRWLSGSEGLDQFGLWNYVSHRLTSLREQIVAGLNQGNPLSRLPHLFQPYFVDGEIVLHSDGDQGRRVMDILESEGPVPARAAYALATRRANLQQMNQVAQLTGAMMLAAPGLISASATAKRLTEERRNLRDRADRLIQKLEDEAVERWAQHQDDRLRGRAVAKRWTKRRFGQWRASVDHVLQETANAHAEFGRSRESTTAEFETLKATFLETMRLQAPAKYWNDKAKRHQTAEDAARNRLYVFFPLLGIGLAAAFMGVASLLLRYPPGASATPLYFIISAGLGTLAGVSFWIGRLLTKLYLSEHHLRVDAEEREIMTTTYLALTKEQAADEKDRQIILTALFRNTPDGIVKDDGMADGTVAALLARVVGPK